MIQSKRAIFVIGIVLSIFLLSAAVPAKAPAKTQKKVESTDPALRLQWFEQHQAMKTGTPFAELKWRFLGPGIIGGRCTDVAVPKGSKHTMYVGSATGGLWKTENSGITWTPLFDDMPTPSIGDIAISEFDPNVIYVGTGEANIFRASISGTGVYKSIDAGKTWQHMGLAGTQTIGRIRIHPKNPDIVYVAASGHEWTYNPDRGVFKTTDGGKFWQKVLYTNEKVGSNDLVMDPNNPDILIAATWNRVRERWSDPVPGGEDGLYKTVDGGKTWKELTAGLPNTKTTGRIGINLCLSKPNVVYAFVDNHTPLRMPKEGERDVYGRLRTYPDIVGAEVYRSDDQGETWKKVSPSDRLMERLGETYGWVFSQISVDPSNPDTVYIMGVGLYQSTDGGKSFHVLNYPNLHDDHHGLWIDPSDSNYMINVNDGGTNVTYDGGKSWRDFYKGIPTIQFYNVALDNLKPFTAYGSVQDWGTYRAVGAGPEPQGRRRIVPEPRWETAPGGEATNIAIDPTDSSIIYSSSYYGRVERSEFEDGKWTSKVIYPKPAEGEPLYRGQWLAPTIVSAHNPCVLYHGFQYVFRSMDKGETWKKISADLTYNDPKKQGKLPYAIQYATLTTLSESPFKFGVLYAGTDDGRVHVTKNGGESWIEITAGLPYNKHVWSLTASTHDPATVYITLIGRHDDDFAPYVFKSTDYGKTWMSIVANLPGGPVNVLREDPKKKGVLYAGSDLGVYVTTDGAKTWSYLGSGLPNTPVWDIRIHPRDNALVIATNGRGLWIIDDLSDLQK
jgi:photosystem II stability/assembly factor-like uncharacterized protein